MDDTGCTSLVLFNKDVSQLIGKTADELLKDLDEVIKSLICFDEILKS